MKDLIDTGIEFLREILTAIFNNDNSNNKPAE